MSPGPKPSGNKRCGPRPVKADDTEQATAYAYRLLGYRQRSEAELIKRLRMRGFDEPTATGVTMRLRDMGYLDDKQMAVHLRIQAEDSRMLGLVGARQLMRTRGIGAEETEEALSGYEEEDGARRLAEKRIGKLKGLGRQQARQRLAGYLKRRGFSYDTIRKTLDEFIKETWQ